MIQAALPTLFQEANQAGGIRRRMLISLFAAALVYGSVAACAMWLATPLVVMLFGDAYAGIGQAISLLCVAIPGTTLRITTGAVLMARSRPWERILSEITGVATIIIAAILLVPKFEIYGMISACVAAEWIMACVGMFFVFNRGHGKT